MARDLAQETRTTWLETRPEIVVRQWYCRNWNVLGLEATKFQNTKADSEEVSSSKFS